MALTPLSVILWTLRSNRRWLKSPFLLVHDAPVEL